LTFPSDILGKTVVVSIEPVPDDSPASPVLKPLTGDIPEDSETLVNYSLDNQAVKFPAGIAGIK